MTDDHEPVYWLRTQVASAHQFGAVNVCVNTDEAVRLLRVFDELGYRVKRLEKLIDLLIDRLPKEPS